MRLRVFSRFQVEIEAQLNAKTPYFKRHDGASECLRYALQIQCALILTQRSVVSESIYLAV